MGMHEYDETTDDLAWAVFRYALNRIRMDPPLDGPLTVEQLRDAVGQTITRDGLGGDEALAVFADHLAPACISADHPGTWHSCPERPRKRRLSSTSSSVPRPSAGPRGWTPPAPSTRRTRRSAGSRTWRECRQRRADASSPAEPWATSQRSSQHAIRPAAGQEGRSAGLSWLLKAPIRPWRRRPGSWT